MRAALRIATAAIVISSLAVGLDSQADPEFVRKRDAAIRRFRASPSLGAFSEAGIAIMEAAGLRATEGSNSLPPKNREFESMKSTLAAGITVSMPPIPTQVQFYSPTDRVTLEMLPKVRSSFFRRDESLFVIALRPFKLVDEDIVSLVDALSAVNRLTMRVRVAEPMSWNIHGGPHGAWDVGSVDARFDAEALVHGVTRDGRSTGYNVRAVRVPVGSQYCSSRDGSVIGTRVNPGWDSSIVAWIGRSAPGNAIVTSYASGKSAVHEKIVTETIDLDRDGVPDFSAWAGIDKSTIVEEIDIPWKAVFVNLGGDWVLGAYRSAPDCT